MEALADSRSLDEFIASFYAEASLDSHGKFTLDLEKRYQKTTQYQFTQPEKFILPLVMAATLGGARSIELVSHRDGFSIAFDGCICSQDELSQLQQALVHKRSLEGPLRLQHLQTALAMAQELGLAGVSLQVGGQCWQLDRGTFAPASGADSLRLRHSGGLLANFFGGRMAKVKTAVEKWLSARCSYRPGCVHRLPAVLQGAHLLIGQGPPPGWSLVSPRDLCGKLSNRRWQGFLTLLDGQAKSEAILVLNGVSFRLPAPTQGLGCPFLMMLWGYDLDCDLACENLVENDKFRDLLSSLPLWLGCLSWQQLLRAWQLGGRESFSAQPGMAHTLWSYRQQVLHGLGSLRVEWNEEVHSLNLEAAGQAYARHQRLPWSLSAGSLPDATPLWVKPTPDDWIVDLVFPRQIEYVVEAGEVAPRQAFPHQMLEPQQFWACSPLSDGLQMGLQRGFASGVLWLYEADGARLGLAKIVRPEYPLPQGLTLAYLGDPERLAEPDWPYARLAQLHKLAWTDPETGISNQRVLALLQHWLRAYLIPSVAAHLDVTVPYFRHQDGRYVHLTELVPGSRWTWSEKGPWLLDLPTVELLRRVFVGVDFPPRSTSL